MTAIRPFISAAAAAALAFSAQTGQAQQPAAATAPTGPVAVIDMAEVFANYDKFEDVRETLKAEIQAEGAKAEGLAKEVQTLQAQLQAGTIAQDSEEYLQKAVALKNKQTELQAEQMRISQRFMKKEAELYKEIYNDVTAMVKMWCERKSYSLVIRYKRDGVDEAKQTNDILQGMNRLVVYHTPQDDITDTIIYALDRSYSAKSGKPARDQSVEGYVSPYAPKTAEAPAVPGN
ncbi:OmpH family outer membrane protein [Alienimonas californiensis]|uniref:Outer membrane protein (OmpH-like) n=1 Tax=Alienimonas californiensis TaxID=2527989 RepID=A0A517PDM9_9PLAN|nr:OmpH family outer membrane protein [Alienimonas californiensis]QDT17495.1 Outer membrane protein (OmpH-like) [Alienimonas californiensis]